MATLDFSNVRYLYYKTPSMARRMQLNYFYINGEKVYTRPVTKNWFYFKAGEPNTNVFMQATGTPGVTPNLQYTEDGITWYDFVAGTTEIVLPNVGDQIWMRNKSSQNSITASDLNNYWSFQTTSGKLIIGGYINSLLTSSSFTSSTYRLQNYAFFCLFKGNTRLVDASDLKMGSKDCGYDSYSRMFQDCTGLVHCADWYWSDPPWYFWGWYSFSGMFNGCTNLLDGPRRFKYGINNTGNQSYTNMYNGCAKFASPITFTGGFQNLATMYANMFSGCSSLPSITVDWTSWTVGSSGYAPTKDWLLDANPNGVFHCPSSLTIPERSASGLPEGWTIEYTN